MRSPSPALEAPPAPPTGLPRPKRAPARRAERVDDAARRLRDLLRSQIFAGTFPDRFLPSETDLMETHKVRRAAVREALSMLRSEGVVERLQGIGTFAVRERQVMSVSETHGVVENGGWFDDRQRPEPLDESVVPAPELVATKLGLDPGDPVLRLEYVAHFDGGPQAVATNYLAFPEAQAVTETPFRSDWFALLRDADLRIGDSECVFGCVNADAPVARLLDLAPGSALMLGEQLIWDEQGRPFDFALCYIRTDRYAFSSRASAIKSLGRPFPLLSLEEA